MDAIADTLQMPSVELVTTTDLLMLQQRIEQLEETIESLKQTVEELQTTVNRLDYENDSLRRWISSVERQLDDHEKDDYVHY